MKADRLLTILAIIFFVMVSGVDIALIFLSTTAINQKQMSGFYNGD